MGCKSAPRAVPPQAPIACIIPRRETGPLFVVDMVETLSKRRLLIDRLEALFVVISAPCASRKARRGKKKQLSPTVAWVRESGAMTAKRVCAIIHWLFDHHD